MLITLYRSHSSRTLFRLKNRPLPGDPQLLPAPSPGEADINGPGPSPPPPSPESSWRASFSARRPVGREMPSPSPAAWPLSLSPRQPPPVVPGRAELPRGGSTSPSCRKSPAGVAGVRCNPQPLPVGFHSAFQRRQLAKLSSFKGGRRPQKASPAAAPCPGMGSSHSLGSEVPAPRCLRE